MTGSFTADEARRVGEEIGIRWETAPFDVDTRLEAMERDAEQERALPL